MNELFIIEPIKIGTKAVNAINARELHERLHSKQDFSTWIKKRLEACYAKEGEDYILWTKISKPISQILKNDRLGQIFNACFMPPKERAKIEQDVAHQVFHKTMENLKSVQSGSESSTKDSNLDSQIHDSHREVVCDDFKGCGVRGSLLNINDQAECEHSIKSTQNTSETSEGGRPKIEYIITLELAKHIAMLEKNEIGRHIRQYFIDFENTHRESSNHLSNPHIKGLLDIAKSQIAAIEKTQKNLEIVAKKVQVLESTKRLESWQERALSDSVKAKVYELTNGREVSPKVVSAYYRAIYKRLKGKYYVARYSEIPCVKFDEALHYVECISNDDLIS